MVRYQIWFTIDKNPSLNPEVLKIIKDDDKITNFFIQRSTADRILIRGLTITEKIIELYYFFERTYRNPLILDVRNQAGIRYGYQLLDNEIQPVLMEEQTQYDWDEIVFPQPNWNVFPLNETEYYSLMAPYQTNDDGQLITVTPSSNNTFGWATWEQRL